MTFRSFSNCFFSVLLIVSSFLFFQGVKGSYLLHIDLVSEAGTETEVFWAKNNEAFNPAKSKRQVNQGGRNIIEFSIPAYNLSYIRIDPTSDKNVSLINSVQITLGFGVEKRWEGSTLSEFKPLTPGTIIRQDEDKLIVSNSEGDPAVITPELFMNSNIIFLSAILIVVSAFSLFINKFSILISPFPIEFQNVRHVVFSAMFLFSIMVLLKLNGSSVDSWQTFHSGENKAAILGFAKNVRSDEWLVSTTGILSQLNQTPALAANNPALGTGNAPLVFGLPVGHFSLLFRPANWGFFIFDSERAFSFSWNVKLLTCFLGVFLLLCVLTNGKVLQSLSLSIMFYYSAYLQWWQSTLLPELIGSACLSTYFLLRSIDENSYFKKLGFSFLSCLFALTFITAIYPPFQVPIGWAVLMVLLVEWNKRNFKFQQAAALNIALVVVSIFILLIPYYLSIAESLSLLANTSYPGKRRFTGGEMPWKEIFRGFYSPLWNEDSFPRKYGNVCEASSFIFIFPLVFSYLLLNLNSLRCVRFLFPLIFYVIIILVFIVAGVPQWIATLTGFSFVYSNRALVGLGVADIFLTAAFIGNLDKMPRPGLLGSVLPVLIWLILNFTSSYPAVLLTPDVMVYVFLLSLVGLVIIGHTFWLASLVAVSFSANFLINPLTHGLSPILQSQEFVLGRSIEKKFPHGRVIVLNDIMVSRLLAAAGVDVISGARLIPDRELYKQIDAEEKNLTAYNRFAHTSFDISQHTNFKILQDDRLNISLAGCKDLLSLKIDLVVVSDKNNFSELDGCVEELSEVRIDGWKVLKLLK